MERKIMKLKNALSIAFIIVCFGLFVYLAYSYWPGIGVDWRGVYQPASLALLDGKSPYGITALPFVNPPWVLVPLLPVAIFPPAWGSAIMLVLNIGAYVFVAMRLGMKVWMVVPFIFMTMNNNTNGNIDGLVALGFLLPAQVGLFFVLVKPQIGIAVAMFWAVEAWRVGGAREVARTFVPVILAYCLSFLLFGFWMADMGKMLHVGWNTSIFAYGVPVGAALMALALWKRDIRFAIAASPFFAPYLTGHSWAVVGLGLMSLKFKINKKESE
jgi:flagellar biosynthesis protein FliQ